jgi:O-antigen ligase
MFTVPWDVIPIPGLGTSTRLVGIAVIGAAVLTVLAEGRFRKPDMIFGLAIAFTVASALSLLWTISYSATVEAAWSYAQLLASVWVAREVARTREQQQWLLVAVCLGLFVPLGGLLNNYRTGVYHYSLGSRFTADGYNADAVGLLLALGIPIAWHLVLTFTGAVRAMALTYFAIAPIGILLTGTRGAFLTGIVALSIVPLNLARQSWRSIALVTVLLVVTVVTTATMVPTSSWARISTIPAELTGGNMNSRRELWDAGFDAFPDHPVLGVGAGAYGSLFEIQGKKFLPAHNIVIGLLVEQGILGLSLFAALLGACVVLICRMPPADRNLWGVLVLCLLIGLMSVSGERWKVTWLLFGLLSAQSGVEMPLRHVRRSERKRAAAA